MKLTRKQVAAIDERLAAIFERGGYGSVELIVERGLVTAVRTTDSQRMLDELIDRRTT